MSQEIRPPGLLNPPGAPNQGVLAGDNSPGQIDTGNVLTPSLQIIGFGYQMVDATFKAVCRFEIPAQMPVVRKVRISFSLKKFRAGQQTAAAAAASGAHNHQMLNYQGNAGGSPGPFNLTSFLGKDSGGSDVLWSIAGGFAIPSDDFYTYDTATDHTHALTLSPPGGLYETGMAQGVHVLVNGVDRTTELGGPWGVGVALDVTNIDLTQYINKPGVHEILLSSTNIGGIIPQVQIVGSINAT